MRLSQEREKEIRHRLNRIKSVPFYEIVTDFLDLLEEIDALREENEELREQLRDLVDNMATCQSEAELDLYTEARNGFKSLLVEIEK